MSLAFHIGLQGFEDDAALTPVTIPYLLTACLQRLCLRIEDWFSMRKHNLFGLLHECEYLVQFNAV